MADNLNQILGKLTSINILVVGDIMLDHYIWGDAHRISPEAPVPVIHVERDSYAAGGAANVALNVRALGGSCELIGIVGDDQSAEHISSILSDAGVVFDQACRRADTPTIVKTRVVVRNQQLCRLDREEPPAAYSIDTLLFDGSLPERLKAADALILSDYAKGAVTTDTMTSLSQACRENNCLLAVDPKPRRQLTFTDVDLITPNRNEALEMAGIRLGHHDTFPDDEVCHAIRENYRPKNLVVTLGGDGMLLSQTGKANKRIPTLALEVYDVSGAGDTVIAALTCALATGANLEDAANFANHAAGVVVAKVGTATASPEEILEHYHLAKNV